MRRGKSMETGNLPTTTYIHYVFAVSIKDLRTSIAFEIPHRTVDRAHRKFVSTNCQLFTLRILSKKTLFSMKYSNIFRMSNSLCMFHLNLPSTCENRKFSF